MNSSSTGTAVEANKETGASLPPIPDNRFTHVQINHVQNAIVEIVFLDASAAAVDELFNYLTYINGIAKAGQYYLELWDARCGMISISRSIQESRKLMARFPNMGPHRIAIVYQQRQNSLLQAGISLLNMLPVGKLKFRYFNEQHYDDAVAWLLANK